MTRVIHTARELREYVTMTKRNRFSLGFVPTMGALHDGHLSLVHRSVQDNDCTIVSVYVNPLQFGEGEDFESYPRTLDTDVGICEEANADVVFAPTVREMQRPGRSTVVVVRGVTEEFEGARRPRHFEGVATIVTTLLNMVQPDRAYFGQKDYQQTLVIRRLVSDLAVPVEVVVCPIVRDEDGLALSSRNRSLSPEDREEALRLPQALARAEQLANEGERDANRLRAAMVEMTASVRDDVLLDYADVVDPDTLIPLETIETRALLIAVLRVGTTRLLDNVVVRTGGVA